MEADTRRPELSARELSLADKEESLDDMRKMLLARMRDRRLTFADLSRAVGGNAAYIHQFFYRGIPKYLPEARRARIAAMLEVDEVELMNPNGLELLVSRRSPRSADVPQQGPWTPPARHSTFDLRAPSARPQMTSSPPAGAPVARQDREVPIYSEGDTVDTTLASDWAPGPGHSSMGSASFAVWVRAPRGRFSAGDLAYVVTNRPPRAGDAVVVVQDGTLRTIGDLVSVTDTEATVSTGVTSTQCYDLLSCKLHKVAGVQYA
jgi:hypothetical protein